MELTRRTFLKASGLSVGASVAGVLGFDIKPALARVQELKISKAKAVKSVCTYCSVSCGVLIYSLTDGAYNLTKKWDTFFIISGHKGT